jgi:hypothetical protein
VTGTVAVEQTAPVTSSIPSITSISWGIHSLGEVGQLVNMPCRSVIGFEACTEAFEPLVHAVDVLGRTLSGENTLDDSELRKAHVAIRRLPIRQKKAERGKRKQYVSADTAYVNGR